MRSLASYALFQGVWLAAVWGAGRGWLHLGLPAALGMLALHLVLTPGGERGRELAYVAAVALAGAGVDSGLRAAGLILYPTSEAWPLPFVPPWILGLWLAFATLPRFSLAWLRPRPGLAALLGAAGGPLSFLAGARLGPVAAGSSATWVLLAVEYALAVPLMLRLAPRPTGAAASERAASDRALRGGSS